MPGEMSGAAGGEGNAEIQVEVLFIGFPKIFDLLHSNQVRHSCSGKTLPDLVSDLISRYGDPVRKSLLEGNTQRLDPTIQIRLNGKRVRREEFDRLTIREGDTLTFLRLLAGG